MSEMDPENRTTDSRNSNLIDREKLYEMVWAEPVTTIAECLGVSGVAVGKWCKKLGVPRPGRGYWARKAVGQRVRQPPLPPPKKRQHRYVSPPRSERRTAPPPEDIPGLEHFECPIPAPDSSEDAHYLVIKTRQAIKGARSDEYGIIRPRAWKRLEVWVSEACVERAMRIMNALVVALENAGYEVGITVVNDGDGRRRGYETFAIIDGERVFFSLREKTCRTEREPTSKERARMERYSWERGPFYDYGATGRLSLRIEGDWYGERHRRTWSDGKRQRLEDRLYQFVRSLLLSAAVIKRRRREAEERGIREEQERIRREEEERRRLAEARRRHALENAAFGWGHAMRLRRFLEAAEEVVAADTDMTTESEDAFRTWLAWARRYADAVDPLFPTAGVAGRLAAVSEDSFPKTGVWDALKQIEYDVHGISRNLSSLDSRFRWGRGW